MPTAISNLVELVRQRAEDRPDDTAYVFLSGGDLRPSGLTYSQLNIEARAIAAFLRGLRLQGERVLLLYPPGLEFVAAFLGCLYAGVVAVPAYPPRLNRNAFRILSIAEDSQARVALTTTAVTSRLNTFTAHTPEFGKMRWVATDHLEPALADDWRDSRRAEEDLAYLQYTSGSTATPRGVMVTHANVLHNSAYIAEGFEHTPESVSLCWLPHFHDMGLMDGIIQPLYSGFTGYLMSPASLLQEPVRWLEAISRYRVTHSGGPNFAYDLCSAKISSEQRERLDLSGWKVAYNGAEPVHARTIELFVRQFGPCGFRRGAFYPAYGLAEATLKVSGGKKGNGPSCCTVKTRELEQNRVAITHADDPEGRTLVGAGRAAHGMNIVVVDQVSGLECAAEEVGEIWVCGPGVAAGYWNRPEETRQVFEAVMNGDRNRRFLRTGDLGFVRDGELFVTGRLKDLIIIRGRNHYPQDIEATVQLSHPILRGMPGAAFSITAGSEEKLGFVQEVDPRRAELFGKITEAIRRAVAEEHEIQPYAVLLLPAGAVPRTSSGKIQHHLCRDKFLRGSFRILSEWRESNAEGAENHDDAAPLELTSDSLELWLRSQFAAKLKRDLSEINSRELIAHLGLDSMMALEISHRIETALGVSLSQSSLLEGWSIAGLADHILSELHLPPSQDSGPVVLAGAKARGQYPLSQGQQALWFLQRLAPESRAYHIARILRLSGEIDAAALQRAFRILIDRHASLRAVISVVDGKPMQHVDGQAGGFFSYEDAFSWDSTRLQETLRDAAGRSFDLSRGPLFRVFLFSLSACDHLLLLSVHHIVADLWSLGLLLNELSDIYTAEIRNIPLDLPPLSVRYADYVDWEEKFLGSEEADRHWRYWQRHLTGELPSLNLPIDFPRPPAQTYKGAVKFAELDAELVRGLKSAAVRYNTTPYTVLLGLFETFLHRYTGQEDLLIGTPTSGRSRSEFAGIVGYFVNPVVIRVDVSSDLSFEQVAVRTRRVVLEALEHQNFPFATLVRRLEPQRDPSRSPLFQVMFVLQNTSLLPGEELAAFALGAPGREMRLGDLSFESAPSEPGIAQFDLTLAIAETGGGMAASLEYNTGLFEDATAERMMNHFDRLVRGCIAHPSRPISEIPLLSDEERRQVVVEWNRTERAYPVCETVLDLLEAQARQSPDNPAVTFEGTSLTYRELHQQANQLARFLRKLGVGPEVPVGVFMERSAHLVIALLGILKAGGAYVPLDPGYPAERLNYILQDVQASVLLSGTGLEEKLQCVAARRVCLDKEWDVIRAESQEAIESRVSGENLAYVIYTSGSTGQPKGVMSIHSGLLNRLQWMQEVYGLDERDRVLQKTPFGFDVSVWEFFWPLLYGGCVVMARAEGHKDSGYLVRMIQREKITTLHFVPSMLRVFLREPGLEECGSLRRVIASGEELPVNLVEKFRKRMAAELHNLYGPTEASIDVSFWACRGPQERGSVPIGRPIANTQLYVLDSHLQPVPAAVTGELYIGGAGLARGYWRRAELTAEKFIPDPFSSRTGDRLYRSGDLARWHGDGTLEYVGRGDRQIKLRGFRIELGEIEAVLAQHESVQQALVVLQEDGNEKRLIAYVVPAGGERIQTAALRDYAREKLPGYMLPSAFTELPALPLSANGKVDRNALPRWEFTAAERESAPPRTPTEELLAGIWSNVLGIGAAGIHDNFFDLGGHSLLATQVLSRVRETFLVDLPLQAIFETPTVAALSERLDRAMSGGRLSASVPISRAQRHGDVPLSFAQERMWFLHQIIPDKSAYNIIEGVRLSGDPDPVALNASLLEIIRRHEILRAGFVAVEGRCVQRIASAPEWRLEVLDLRKTRDTEEVRRLVREEARKAFDLERGPLLRATLLKSAAQEHILLLAMHHIVADGWSFSVLLRELTELHSAYCGKKDPGLNELPIQYADYAEWQRQYLSGEVLERGLAYWKRQLAGAPSHLLLPADHPRPAVQSFRGKRYRFELSKDVSDRLKELSRHQGVTLFMVLLAGLKVLLARYSGEHDIVVGTVTANRNRGEIEGLIGLFANTLALRTDFIPVSTVVDVLQRVREVCVGAYIHQELPFEKVVAELDPERDWGRTPIFQVMFAWQSQPAEDRQLAGLRATRLPVEEESETAKFDISFLIGESGDGLPGVIEYNSDLFETQTISRIFGHYRRVLEEMARDSGQSVWKLPLLSESERRQLLVEWNQTESDYPRRCAHELFEAQVERTPQAVAVVSETRQLTYAELNRQANRLANYLRALGVGPEVRAGIFMDRGPGMVVAILGIVKAGGAYVPLDKSYPPERLGYMIKDAGLNLLLTQEELLTRLPGTEVTLICLDRDWREIAKGSPGNLASLTIPENLAYVIYTSGSTGTPKGVAVTHRGLVNLITWHRNAYHVTPSDRAMQVAMQAFDASVWELWPYLVSGSCIDLPGPEILELPDRLFRWIAERRVTISFLPTPLAEMFVNAPLPDGLKLRELLTGGDRLHQGGWSHLPFSLTNHYGPTENTVVTTSAPVAAGETPAIGKPIANTRVYVVDREMMPVPVGAAGELYIGGTGLARGYMNRPELTAERFVPDPFSRTGGDRLYRTGDQVRWRANGNLEFLGRLDHQVKMHGCRIEPGEIEWALTQHHDVHEAVVTAQEKASGEKALIAYVVMSPETRPESSKLRQHLQGRLPQYMVPAAFVRLDAIPLTVSGKVDRRALRQWEFIASDDRQGSRTATEEKLTGIWKELLRLEAIGIHDDFFELGGDSIISLQVVARAQQRGIRITPRQLFECPTIAALAAVAEPVEDSLNQSAEQGIVEGDVPLTPIQRWFFEQGMEEVHHYNQAALLRAGEELNSEWLETAWKKLAEHHDALRLRYRSEQGEWRQRNAGREESQFFSVVELKGDKEEQAREMERVIAEMQQSLELERGPVLRVTYVKPDRVVVVIHHLAVDGVSWRIIVEDLESAYRQLSRGEAIKLPARTSSYRRWAEALARGAEVGRYEEELGYWLREREEEPAAEKMPRDREGGENREARRGQIKVEFDRERTRQLLQEVPGAYHTQINDVLLAAVLGAWEKWTGQPRLLIDVEGHGREGGEDGEDGEEGMDLSRTVGWFTAVYPVRLEVGKEEGIGERLKGIKEQLRRVPGQGVGYGVLRYMNKDRGVKERLSGQRAAEISFNYLGQVDAGAVEEGLFRRMEALEENSRGGRNRRSHLLEVEGRVQGGRLRVEWMYSQEAHRRETIEALARGFVGELGEIIRHCLAHGVGGFTPSDFPEAELSQRDLDDLIAEIG